MVRDIANKFDIDLGESYLIGDALSDMEMGQRAGCKSILVLTGKGKETETSLVESGLPVEFIAENILEAAKWITQNFYRVQGVQDSRGQGKSLKK